jgi:Family of unknown function (DUF5681)
MMTMTYEIGYGMPPKHTRFQKGNNANPMGRKKRKPQEIAAIINDASNETIEYRERGRTKKATWRELSFRAQIRRALGGNLRSIEMVIKELALVLRVGDSNPTVEVQGWLPDYPGQTGEQKTREFAEQGEAKAPEWWKRSGADPAAEGS